MNTKNKGQGALEYLLLIGGAVLIAVIVIALLVGMGGQSRDTASQQADRAQQASDIPQPAQIVAVETNTADCMNNPAGLDVNVSWRAIGEGGSYTLHLVDNSDANITNPVTLDPTNTTHQVVDINVGSVDNCGDSYYAYIETQKNQQTATSSRFRFGWW